MLDFFITNKYDSKTAVLDGQKSYTFLDLKKNIAYFTEILKDKKQNIVISNPNNLYFILQFFACAFASKKIHIVSDRKKINELDFDFDSLDDIEIKSVDNFEFKKIDTNKVEINLHTSGSSGKSKTIKKTLFNLIQEAHDVGEQFDLKGKNYTSISTTTMCHLFGLTFHLMTSMYNGLIINTKKVSYPENVNVENAVLISTPGFLNSIYKYNMQFSVSPKYIISAGSKLDENIFERLEKQSKIIEIYGSTETGVIAHKTHHSDDFTLFKNVEVKAGVDNIEVFSNYLYGKSAIINDKVEIQNRNLKIKKRTDRLFKINEKRISAEDLENKLKENPYVKDCYIIKTENKLGCLCALSDLGREYLLENNIVELIKILKHHLIKYSEIIPQRWKFIDEIPIGQTGKINKNLIEHIFNVNLSLPVILNRKIEQDITTYQIYFFEQCNFFKGHFPNFNIVPGVVQIYLAKEIANARYNLELIGGQWKRIKFANIILPNSIVNLKLEKKQEQVTYEYFDDAKKYASGAFLCENIFDKALL